ncbi:MAG: hypothetical protein ACQERN_13175 [Thermodesulfobacteriota bacterium]
MTITLSSGRKIDTEKELTAEERHIVQKLYAWQSVVETPEAFREKIRQAFDSGWNNSGPVARRDIMQQIVADLEKTVIARLKQT